MGCICASGQNTCAEWIYCCLLQPGSVCPNGARLGKTPLSIERGVRGAECDYAASLRGLRFARHCSGSLSVRRVHARLFSMETNAASKHYDEIAAGIHAAQLDAGGVSSIQLPFRRCGVWGRLGTTCHIAIARNRRIVSGVFPRT
jgi:hypothetical protein